MSNRVLVVGWDGATWSVARPLIAQGRLPNLARLMAEGAHGPLCSATPPITPTAWTSFFTGKNPGKHGIFDFQEMDPQSYEFRSVRADRHREKSLWQLLSEAGKRSIVIDVPYTHPARPLDGWMITGYGTPRTPGTIFTYPENLAQQMPTELRSEIRVAQPRSRFDRSDAFLAEWDEIMAGRERLLAHLVREPWDLFMVVFSITDNLAHALWTFVDPAHPNYYRPEGEKFRAGFFAAYERCDVLLGQLMEAAGPEAITLVMSDHGFGSVRPRQYIFQQLAEGGYLRYQSPPLLGALGGRAMATAMRAYQELPWLREWVKNLRPGQQQSVKSALQRGNLLPSGKTINPAHSEVIPSNYGLQLWVNEQGRFAQGIVPPAEKEKLLDELRAYLLGLRDPITNQPVIQAVYQGVALYKGSHSAEGPDLVIEFADFYQPDGPPPPRNPYLEGGHIDEGILLMHGDPISATPLQGASLIDLAPTILHLLGQPVPSDMDGQVLQTALTPEHRRAHPVHAGGAARMDGPTPVAPDYTAEEEAAVTEQLRALGYLE